MRKKAFSLKIFTLIDGNFIFSNSLSSVSNAKEQITSFGELIGFDTKTVGVKKKLSFISTEQLFPETLSRKKCFIFSLN